MIRFHLFRIRFVNPCVLYARPDYGAYFHLRFENCSIPRENL